MADRAQRADAVRAGEHAHRAPHHARAVGAHIGALVVKDHVVEAEQASLGVDRRAHAMTLLA